MTTENAHVAKEMTKRRGLVFALTIEFILGVILTTLLNYDPAKHSFAQNAVLIVSGLSS